MDKNFCHNDALQRFNDTLFVDILTMENVVSKKEAITVDKEKYYGFFLSKGNYLYFLQDVKTGCVLDELPIKVTKKTETDYNKKVFYFITSYNSVKIPNVEKLKFRELIDTISAFKHTNPKHFTLYKIINIAGYVDRVNYRVITEKGFGKDCVVNTIRDLCGSVANIYGATYAKLEYSLKHKYLVFNEMGNLKSEEKYDMQQFLLATGAFFNKYTKRSRASAGTLEEYDISKTSLGILYNPPNYYVDKGQEFFDTMFTTAVQSRFIPFYFTGMLDEKFDTEFDVDKVVKDNLQLYKDVISTIQYHRANTVPQSKYKLPDDIAFNEDTRRFERSFTTICNYISMYAKNEEEYYDLVYELYNSYIGYDKIAKDALKFYTKVRE